MRQLACAVVISFMFGFVGTGLLSAQTVRWELTDVVFDDGATATGSFDYDPSTGSVEDWSISVQDGDTATFPAMEYTPENCTVQVFPEEIGVTIIWFVNDSTRLVGVQSAADLTAAGGSVGLVLGLDSASAECFNCAPYRLIAAGSLYGHTPEQVYFVPAFGATAGGSGSQWNSSLQLINLEDEDNDLTIRYLGSATTPAPEVSMTLAAGHMASLENLMSTFGVAGVGSLSITSSGALGGVSRIYSTDGGEGTVGQSFLLVPDEDLFRTGEIAVAPLAGDTSRFRSNLGWYQHERGVVEFRFLDASGNLLGSIEQSFGDHTYVQKSAGAWLGATLGNGARVEARVISGQGIGFASDIDNTTNDPTTKPFISLNRH